MPNFVFTEPIISIIILECKDNKYFDARIINLLGSTNLYLGRLQIRRG